VPVEGRGVDDGANRDEDCTAYYRGLARPRIHLRVLQTAAAFVVSVLQPARIEHDSPQTDGSGAKSHQPSTCYPSLRR
jgi:hypothetical protein